MFKIGVMGCGAVASFGHLPAISAVSGLQLAAIFDPDPARVNHLGSEYPQAWRFTNDREFFENCPDLDAVVIASPSPVHLENARLAAEFGKPLLCEKPLAATEQDAVVMKDLMASKDLALFTGFCYRFSPVSTQIKQLIEWGAIGDVRVVRLVYLWALDGKHVDGSDGERIANARREERMREGGPMVDCGVHLIDLARWWTGSEFVRIKGEGAWVEEYAAPDHVWLFAEHASGAVTHIETSFSYTSTSREHASIFTYEIIGTKGTIRYDRDGWRLEMRNGDGTQYFAGASEKNFYGMYAALEEWLRTGEQGILPSAADGILATHIAYDATSQAIAGRSVHHQS